MICILHGYLLDGSGSNLWTQAIVRTLCRDGQTVHLMCQEPHPERFDFIAEAYRYDEVLRPTATVRREVPYTGRCIMHKPTLGGVLPVYVWDKYEEYDRVVPMVELDDNSVEDYVERNVALLDRLMREHCFSAIHANHAVLMSVVAQRIAQRHAVPYVVMPHGSAIEYAVKKDARFHRLASAALAGAGRIFVIGPELRERVRTVFSQVDGLEDKLVTLNLGVDTGLFEPVAPERRSENIRGLSRALEGIERGKNPDLSRTMRHRLGDNLSRPALRKVLTQASDYTAKHTDTDCEEKLGRVDWEHEQILLFVGRLIASKGVHGIVAAMPEILARVPQARLLVVGHGPMREPLEAMLWAMDTGNTSLLRNIVSWGRHLEGGREAEPLEHVQCYLDRLEADGRLETYLQSARQLRVSERVVFTGYLTHRELRFLFPCCDVAIFPSIVAEAGPMVFLEAMASGVFPMGVHFAGMGASIDSAAEVLPEEVVRLMKLRREPEHTVADIAHNVVEALAHGRRHAMDLRRAAVERYDWVAVGRRFLATLEGL